MNITPRTVSSAPCNLRLYHVTEVLRFAVAAARAHVAVTGEPVVPDLVPGTLTLSDQCIEDGWQKSHVYRMRAHGDADIETLGRLRHGLYIAIYTDERGVDRVCGSPSHPLTLTYTRSGASWQCTLTGHCAHPDLPLDEAVSHLEY